MFSFFQNKNRYDNSDLDLKSIDSRSFTKNNNNLLKDLSNYDLDENNNYKILNSRKLKIGYYFMKTIYMMLWINDNIKNNIKQHIPPAILNGTDIILPQRLSFLQYNDISISKNIALTLYNNNIKNNIDTRGFLRIITFLLRNNILNDITSRGISLLDDIRENLYEDLEQIYRENNQDEQIISDIADIYLNYGNRERGNELLEIAREIINARERINTRIYIMNNKNPIDYTVYDDSQNVHNHEINNSVKNIMNKLVKNYYNNTIINLYKINKELKNKFCNKVLYIDKICNEYTFLENFIKYILKLNYNNNEKIEKEIIEIINNNQYEYSLDIVLKILIDKYPENNDIIIETIDRISFDTSEINGINMSQLLNSIWNFINKSWNYYPELLNRLKEELIEMNNYCTTGHFSRLVNVIQGYVNEEYAMKISNTDQLFSVFSYYLTKKSEEIIDNDNIMNDLLDTEKNPKENYYYIFLEKIINEKLEEIYKEYSSLDKDIEYILEKYCKKKIFIVENKKIKII